MLILHRTALRRRLHTAHGPGCKRFYHRTGRLQDTKDPRLSNLDHLIEDDFAVVRSSYQVPKHPIILAHGLLGFDELHIGGPMLPGVKYWRGITDALAQKGVEVITAEVSPSARIEVRAATLAKSIERKARGKAVNIIAYVIGRCLEMN
jgi:triacylglycerol lipase